jgi:hypothetical protein
LRNDSDEALRVVVERREGHARGYARSEGSATKSGERALGSVSASDSDSVSDSDSDSVSDSVSAVRVQGKGDGHGHGHVVRFQVLLTGISA